MDIGNVGEHARGQSAGRAWRGVGGGGGQHRVEPSINDCPPERRR